MGVWNSTPNRSLVLALDGRCSTGSTVPRKTMFTAILTWLVSFSTINLVSLKSLLRIRRVCIPSNSTGWAIAASSSLIAFSASSRCVCQGRYTTSISTDRRGHILYEKIDCRAAFYCENIAVESGGGYSTVQFGTTPRDAIQCNLHSGKLLCRLTS